MKAPKTQNHFKLRQLLLLQKTSWAIAWLLGIATVLSVLGLVMVAGWFISMAAATGLVAVGLHAFNYLVPSAVIRLFAITRTAARYGDLMISHHAVFGLLKQLRVTFFARWAKLPFLARTSHDTSSQTMQRLVKDIDTLDEFVLRIVSPWVVASVAVIFLMAVAFWLLPQGIWVGLLLLLTLVVSFVVLRLGVAIAQQENELIYQRKSKFLDTLPAITQLLIWQKWQEQVTQMTHLDATHHQLMQKTHQLRRWGGFVIQVVIALAVVLVLVLANAFFGDHELPVFTPETLNTYPFLNPALVLALVLGLFGVIEIVINLVGEPLALGRSIHAKHRLNELVADEKMVPLTPFSQTNETLTLQLQDVSVKQPKAIMSTTPISATFDSQRPTLVVGASGAGKSTLLATLAGEIAPDGGKITLNGMDYTKIECGQSLGFLGQTVDIFDQTLADNLRLGKPDASDDELLAMLDKVGLLAWLQSQPKGLATPLGEYGMAISGGQARRIALARLLLSPKAILLLDEPFAGLDSGTRQKIWQALMAMQKTGQIGILVIATHQVWHELQDANRVVINHV